MSLSVTINSNPPGVQVSPASVYMVQIESRSQPVTVLIDRPVVSVASVGISGSGQPGSDGLSAYQIAVNGGFVGTEAQWLLSLKGADGTDGADSTVPGPAGAAGPAGLAGPAGADGADGSAGSDGLSAYQIAVNAGFSGTEAQWLLSLKGADGADSTVPGPAGPAGAAGAAGAPGATGPAGADGADGSDGLSAYQIAVNGGFVGTEAQWLASLKGATGATDHTQLSNIGNNTHAQIDTALTRLSQTSGTNTGDQDLSGLVPKTITINSKPLSGNISLSATDVGADPAGTAAAVTKTSLGIGNVDNTSDANKPVSTAQQAALNAKEAALGNPSTNAMVLTSTTDGTRSWATPSAAGSSPYFYQPRTNAYYSFPAIIGAPTTTVSISANQLSVVPFVIGMNCTVTAIGFDITGTASGNVRFGIYPSSSNRLDAVTSLILDMGTASLSVAGFKAITGLSLALTAGLYQLVFVTNIACQVRAYTAAQAVPIAGTDAQGYTNLSNPALGRICNFTYGALPSTPPAATGNYTATAPCVVLRLS